VEIVSIGGQGWVEGAPGILALPGGGGVFEKKKKTMWGGDDGENTSKGSCLKKQKKSGRVHFERHMNENPPGQQAPHVVNIGTA